MGNSIRLMALLTGLTLGLQTPAFAQGKEEKPKDIIQIDVSKLPPELAKQLMDFAKAKAAQPGEKSKSNKKKMANTGNVNAISLARAIEIAEKKGEGRAIKAERKDRGETTTFTVEVAISGRDRIRYTLDASGTITKQKKGEKD